MEELNCPLCNNKMINKKGSGILALDYIECESCKISFEKSGKEKYRLKEYEEKHF